MPFTPKFVDLVRNVTTVTGTGPVALGAVVSGFTSLASAVAVGDQFYYCIQGVDKPAEREVGRGAMLANGTVTREPIGGAATNFTTGSKTIALVAAADWFGKIGAWINGGADSLGALTTTNKASLVGAVNEVAAAAAAAAAAAGSSGGGGTPSRTFAASAGSVIASGVTVIETSGHAVAGVGAARYIFDAAVDAAYVTAHPRCAFIAAGGRGFRLCEEQRFNIEMFGALPCVSDGVYAAFVTTGTPTDCKPAFDAYWNYGGHVAFTRRLVIAPLHFGPGNYYFSAALEPYVPVHLIGAIADPANPNGSLLIFPPDTCGMVINIPATGDGGIIPHLSRGVGAGGSIIEHLYFGSQGGSDPTKHGIWVRATVRMMDCVIDSFPGCGTKIYTQSGGGGSIEGNANESYIARCGYRANKGLASFYVGGSDSNACTFDSIRIKDGFGIGILDTSYFGNVYINPQLDGSGDVRGVPEGRGRVWHAGKTYKLAKSTSLNDVPGVDGRIWKGGSAYAAADAYWPAWSSTTTYQSGAGMLMEGGQCTIIGGYNESLIVNTENSAAVILGGNYAPFGHRNNQLLGNGSGAIVGQGLFNANALGSLQYWQQAAQVADRGVYSYATLGSTNGGYSILEHLDEKENIRWTFKRDDLRGNYQYRTDNFIAYTVTGPQTTSTFGRSAPVPGVFNPGVFALGTAARILDIDSAAPTTGYHAQGERVLNANVTATGISEWICTAGGTPGTWKAKLMLVGYGTGSGGAAAQSGDKSTSIDMGGNFPSGQITLNNAALAANASVVFRIYTQAVKPTDTVVVSIASGATLGAYIMTVAEIGDEYFRVHLRNVSTTALNEAVILNFAVVKAVTA